MTTKNKGHLTEEDALKLAKKDGIEFEDKFFLSEPPFFNNALNDKIYDTEEEAVEALSKMKNKAKLTIVQQRSRKS